MEVRQHPRVELESEVADAVLGGQGFSAIPGPELGQWIRREIEQHQEVTGTVGGDPYILLTLANGELRGQRITTPVPPRSCS